MRSSSVLTSRLDDPDGDGAAAALVYISMQFFKTTDTATVLGIPISSRGYNYGCMIGFVGAPLITILPISVVGFYLTKAAVAHGAFQITIQSLVTTPDTPDAGLAATAMLQLDQIRRDELTAWTTFRVLLSAAVVLFLVFLLGLAVLGSRITCGLWKVVRIYKTGVQHMRSLQRMKTVGTFAPAEVGKRATLLFAEANSHAALEEFAQRSQLVWLGDDTSSDDASDAPSPPQSFHGELREQLDEMNVQYRHALIYAVRSTLLVLCRVLYCPRQSVLTFDLVATAILTTMLLALCLFVGQSPRSSSPLTSTWHSPILLAINPLQAPEKTRIADMMTYGGLMIPVAWGATIAVPMAMVSERLAFTLPAQLMKLPPLWSRRLSGSSTTSGRNGSGILELTRTPNRPRYLVQHRSLDRVKQNPGRAGTSCQAHHRPPLPLPLVPPGAAPPPRTRAPRHLQFASASIPLPTTPARAAMLRLWCHPSRHLPRSTRLMCPPRRWSWKGSWLWAKRSFFGWTGCKRGTEAV